MRKIMLVIDDFNELQFIETLLRRLGFDILSLSKDISVSSSILGFFPDLILAQAKSRAVDGISLSQKIRRLAPQSRMVLLHQRGQIPKLSPEVKTCVDGFLESPVETPKLVAMISQMGNLDPNILNEKISRMATSQMSDERRSRIQGKVPSATQSENHMVSGSAAKNQTDVMHVTSKSGLSKQAANFSGGVSESTAARAASEGIHHIHGTNKLKGSVHISGEQGDTGAAYDPTGSQASGLSTDGAAYVPTQQQGEQSGSSGISQSGVQQSARTKRYDEFLAAHDEPVNGVLTQAELKKQAKLLKIETLSDESEINSKREFVRALFRK